MTVQNARLSLKLRAPLREAVISGFAEGAVTPLRTLTSPFGVNQIEISDLRLLRPDKDGALYFSLDVSDLRSETTGDSWFLDWLGLEIRGITADQK